MKKVSKSKIASTYALALYEGAGENKAIARVFTDVDKLIMALNEDSSIIKYLANPIWDVEAKKVAMKEVSHNVGLCKETLNFLDVVADNNRFAELALILEEFKHLYYQKNNIVEVEIQTVKNLGSAQDKQLKDNLEKVLAKKVIVKYEIKPELLGGLVIKYGSSMIDDSIKGKLNRLELIMKGGH